LQFVRKETAHRALATQKKLAYLGFECLDHPPYSPGLAPLDYHLFPGLKKTIQRGLGRAKDFSAPRYLRMYVWKMMQWLLMMLQFCLTMCILEYCLMLRHNHQTGSWHQSEVPNI
jgi:hypothetical protein